MMLNLAAPVLEATKERSVVPACIERRAPLSYEILDEEGRRVPPTLAGYRLRRGQMYRLRVRHQDKTTQHWKLRLVASRRVVEAPGPDEVEEEARLLTFHTTSHPLTEWWNCLRSQVTQVTAQLDYEDGKPYRLSVPIILRASRLRWIGYILLTALGTFGLNYLTRGELVIPRLSHLALSFVILLIVMTVFKAIDLWRSYRQARRLLAALPGNKHEGAKCGFPGKIRGGGLDR